MYAFLFLCCLMSCVPFFFVPNDTPSFYHSRCAHSASSTLHTNSRFPDFLYALVWLQTPSKSMQIHGSELTPMLMGHRSQTRHRRKACFSFNRIFLVAMQSVRIVVAAACAVFVTHCIGYNTYIHTYYMCYMCCVRVVLS